ncbi:MAG: hypothetical protein OXN27_05650 [Candidatus Poribacteria bacterium]|nr:hypothetical protein [Candidatus Poribacteria bacterium]
MCNSKTEKYVDTWLVNEHPTAAGEDCILASSYINGKTEALVY